VTAFGRDITVLPRPDCDRAEHGRFGGCYECCEKCDLNRHACPACAIMLTHNSYEDVALIRRHWLSDCLPDLFRVPDAYGRFPVDRPMTK
jgi:hypothetical protein